MAVVHDRVAIHAGGHLHELEAYIRQELAMAIHASILPHAAHGLRPLLVPLLLLALTGSPEAIGPTVITSVDDLIDAPRTLFGKTRDQVERTLGPPLAVRRQAVPGLLNPEAVETVRELAYPGARIGVSGSAALRRVEITTPAYGLPHGLGIGATRQHVEETLGEPQELTEGRYLYLYSDGYPDTVEVYFRDHRVYRIEWTYWTE
jgi:hypothetical protein